MRMIFTLSVYRRYTPEQRKDQAWARERSHEAYAKNYSIVFPHDEPLAGRNFKQGPFHKVISNSQGPEPFSKFSVPSNRFWNTFYKFRVPKNRFLEPNKIYGS
jgi:hypothetical protein